MKLRSADLKRLGLAAPTRSERAKYRNVRTEYRGELYDSKAEARYAALLEQRVRAGEILAWQRWKHPVVLLNGPTRSERITYKPDFWVQLPTTAEALKDGRICIEAHDVKGALPRDFRLRALLWRAVCQSVPLVVVDAKGNRRDIFARRRAR